MKKVDSFGIKSPGSRSISRSASRSGSGHPCSDSHASITSFIAAPSGSTDQGDLEGSPPSFAPYNVQNWMMNISHLKYISYLNYPSLHLFLFVCTALHCTAIHFRTSLWCGTLYSIANSTITCLPSRALILPHTHTDTHCIL